MHPIVNFGRNVTIGNAFDMAFGEDTLRKLHGNDVVITPWDERNRLVLKFTINMEHVPTELRRIFCGSRMRVTAKQQLVREEGRCEVSSRMKMHIMGAELIRVRPRFTLKEGPEGLVCMEGCVDHAAMLPPPVNAIAEAFMYNSSKEQLSRYSGIIKESYPRAIAACESHPLQDFISDWNRVSSS